MIEGRSHSTCKEVGEFDRQDDGFLQSFLGSLQSSHIVPPDIGLLHYNSTWTHRQSMIQTDNTTLEMQTEETL